MKKLLILLSGLFLLVIAILLPAQDVNARKWSPNLVGAWAFEGNANDWSGSGHNGTVTGATLTTGKFGQAYSFNGFGDNVSVPDSTSLNFGTGDFTVAAWVYPTGIQSNNNGYWFDDDDGLGIKGISLFVNKNTGKLGGWVGGAIIPASANSLLNGWHFIRVGRLSGNVSVYIDETLDSSFAGAGDVTVLVYPILIGCYRDSLNSKEQFFGGKIDEVGEFNRYLTAGEGRALMSGFSPGELGD